MKILEDDYLGDGVYASYDGIGIALDLRGQEGEHGPTRIVLEPSVLEALNRFAERAAAARANYLRKNNENQD